MTPFNITLGVSSKGNTAALTLCLSGVLNATVVPSVIQLRLEGNPSRLDSFYLEQLACLARMRGVDFNLSLYQSTGVRDTRDWQLDTCPTTYLWMMDDDALPDARCLLAYLEALTTYPDAKALGFLAGSKCDVNNLRKYPGFRYHRCGPSDVHEWSNHSYYYDVEACFGMTAATKVLDTGNVLFNVELIREKGCRFRLFEDSRNPSGDATTFSLTLDKAGVRGRFCPSAVAYHLEKPGGGFNEFEARAEMLLRTCDVKGFDKQIVEEYFMPGLRK